MTRREQRCECGPPAADLTDPVAKRAREAGGAQSSEEIMLRMTPLGRPGKAEEVADLILFLASARAAFIQSANITIDRGANPGLIG